MYTHYYDKLSHDHRQQMQADAAQQRLVKRQPRPAGLGDMPSVSSARPWSRSARAWNGLSSRQDRRCADSLR